MIKESKDPNLFCGLFIIAVELLAEIPINSCMQQQNGIHIKYMHLHCFSPKTNTRHLYTVISLLQVSHFKEERQLYLKYFRCYTFTQQRKLYMGMFCENT